MKLLNVSSGASIELKNKDLKFPDLNRNSETDQCERRVRSAASRSTQRSLGLKPHQIPVRHFREFQIPIAKIEIMKINF